MTRIYMGFSVSGRGALTIPDGFEKE
jgi:hypothetical protein